MGSYALGLREGGQVDHPFQLINNETVTVNSN